MKTKQTLLWCFRVLFPILFYIVFTQVAAAILLSALFVVFAVFYGSGPVEPLKLAYDFYMSHLLLVTVIMSVAVLPFFFWFFNRDKKERCRWDYPGPGYQPVSCFAGCEPVPASNYGFVVLLSIGMCLAVNNIITMLDLQRFFGGYQQVAESLYQNNLLFELIAMGLLIPLTEELLFRGLCFLRLRERLPFWPAALLSALLFGMYHGNLLQGLYAFCLGFAMAYVYERFHSLMAAYVFHAAANILSVLMTETAMRVLVDGMAMRMLTTAAGLVFSFLGYYLIQKNVRGSSRPDAAA